MAIQPVTPLWTDATLLALSSEVVSAFIDVREFDSLRIGRTNASGTYVFEIDWSRNGTTADFAEVVTVTTATTVTKDVAARFARFRVKNTHVTNAFTSHRTIVSGKASSRPVTDGTAAIAGSMRVGEPTRIGGATSFGGQANGYLVVSPFVVPQLATLDRVGVNVSGTAGSAGSVARIGIYADDGAWKPADLLLETVAATTVTGLILVTVNITLSAGLYWVGLVQQGAPATLPSLEYFTSYAAPTQAEKAPWSGPAGAVTGALPASGSAFTRDIATGGVVYLRAA